MPYFLSLPKIWNFVFLFSAAICMWPVAQFSKILRFVFLIQSCAFLWIIIPNFDVESISSLLVLYCGLDNGHWPISRDLARPIIVYNRVALFYSKLSVFLGIYIHFVFWSLIWHYLHYVYQNPVAFPFASLNTRSGFCFQRYFIDMVLHLIKNWVDTPCHRYA